MNRAELNERRGVINGWIHDLRGCGADDAATQIEEKSAECERGGAALTAAGVLASMAFLDAGLRKAARWCKE